MWENAKRKINFLRKNRERSSIDAKNVRNLSHAEETLLSRMKHSINLFRYSLKHCYNLARTTLYPVTLKELGMKRKRNLRN